jgi:hypothetical protein
MLEGKFRELKKQQSPTMSYRSVNTHVIHRQGYFHIYGQHLILGGQEWGVYVRADYL